MGASFGRGYRRPGCGRIDQAHSRKRSQLYKIKMALPLRFCGVIKAPFKHHFLRIPLVLIVFEIYRFQKRSL